MKKNVVILVLIFLVVFFGAVAITEHIKNKTSILPYTIGSQVTPTDGMSMGMVMKTFPVPSTEPNPTIALAVTPDTMEGYNVHVTTNNFSFTPEHLNGAPVAGEGHVHLYIDDNLIIMLGDWYHIDTLTPGTHTIRVGLFNNDHSAYSVDGTHIEATQTITVQ